MTQQVPKWQEKLLGMGGVMFLLSLILLAIGIFFIHSAAPSRTGFSSSYAAKQLVWATIGLTVFIGISCCNYRWLLQRSYSIYLFGLALLLLTSVIGVKRGGARCWLQFGPVLFQTSEVMKLALILILAKVLTAQKSNDRLINLVAPILITFVPMLILFAQPDLGTVMLLVPVVATMVFVGGANIRHCIALALIGVCLGVSMFFLVLHDYQKKRVLMFVFQNQMTLEEKRGAGYHMTQSLIALGNGGLTGRGWRKGTQNRFGFLPERHTDFIFSVIGEEWGFAGTAFVIAIYVFLFFTMLLIAYTTTSPPAQLATIGIMMLLCCQTLINTCMTVGMAPITGLPLPFVSYGGSALLFNFIAIAIVVSINARKTIP